MKRIIPALRSTALVALTTALLLGLNGCASTSEPDPEPTPPPSEFSDADATEAPAPPPMPDPIDVTIDAVYFDFDSANIRPDATDLLRAGSMALQETGVKVVIAGHTDNRGSEEYNLALGERRAASVRRYLANLGVNMSQMTIVSYGEVRPAAQGNTETAWALNRRVEFQIVQ